MLSPTQTSGASPWQMCIRDRYGEGAIGGVVNVIPKKPTRGPIENEIQTTVGTHDTQRLGFGSGGALDDKWSYRLDISGNHSDSGISLGAVSYTHLDVYKRQNMCSADPHTISTRQA